MTYKFVPSTGSATTVLLLHGTGGDENDLIPIGRGLAPGAAFLSPRGEVNEDGMLRFFRRVRPGVFDEDDIRSRAADLECFVRDAALEHGFDVTRVVALGYSNGANMAAALMLLHPNLLSGAVLLRAMLPLTPDSIPALAGIPVLMLQGQNDEIVPTERAQKLAHTLSYAGAKVEVRWHNLGHQLGPEDFTACRDFLANLL